ncbi:MAG: metallophosphoesterase, partial [Ignavibacteriaceae bacterium]|nr:metallophosphoesterase [Ignavibacteriaceae bacterium]
LILFLIIDIIRLLLLPVHKKFKSKINRAQSWGVIIITGFFLVYVPTRILYDYYSVQVSHIEYKKNNLSEELNRFKIVLISDIQADRYTNKSRLTNYIDKVNALKPDLVLIAGDVITSTPNYIKTSADFLGRINSKHGVYSCVGDHDNWAYRDDTQRSLREIKQALAKKNVFMIDNAKKVIDINGAEIFVTFATNTYAEKISKTLLDTLAVQNIKNDFSIFLTHQPLSNLISTARQNNYDLFLAGHTHGGQISFIFPFITLSPTLLETKYVRSAFYFDDMLVYVTRGLGMSLSPVRYNSTPEITEIILKK